ncbi:uncharacterized protein EV420DRAFT_1479808 [Desarmillaria tabescens]|uniref:Uncharacterized protein n=1 Tax=Armillaria tabescens TaxID=1929756 RepID=A0AA39N5V8_ARMTA|nr:uncharacterized protein EV420DRAFT_1479808 [Desarmillaria tabescens]KAK0458569.1 hypothetical protein EV420DRAFT_1479808 [Desarmillaria tabescens]
MSTPKHICQVVKLKPSSAVWPGVLAALEHARIVDYSIHYYAPLRLLIAYMKYTGTDYEVDMKKVAEDPETQRWWAMTDGMQESLIEGATGSGRDIPWWAAYIFATDIPILTGQIQDVEEVFRFEGQP